MFTVVDLSKRLPGPYACMRLQKLGANVSRLEDLDSPDPFNSEEMKVINPTFFEWYNGLNLTKKIEAFPFKNNQSKLKNFFLNLPEYSVIIHSLGDKKEKEIFDVLISAKEIDSKKFIIISIKASIENPHLHDLNALALTGLLDYHSTHFQTQKTIAPPFLPIAGISFGHAIAEKALSLWIKKEHGMHSIYLSDEIRESLGVLKGSVDKALHNGLFPSYQIYKTKDQKFVALATIEDRFWMEFIRISKLNLTLGDRFSSEEAVFKLIEDYFISKDSDEIKDYFHNLTSLTVFP